MPLQWAPILTFPSSFSLPEPGLPVRTSTILAKPLCPAYSSTTTMARSAADVRRDACEADYMASKPRLLCTARAIGAVRPPPPELLEPKD